MKTIVPSISLLISIECAFFSCSSDQGQGQTQTVNKGKIDVSSQNDNLFYDSTDAVGQEQTGTDQSGDGSIQSTGSNAPTTLTVGTLDYRKKQEEDPTKGTLSIVEFRFKVTGFGLARVDETTRRFQITFGVQTIGPDKKVIPELSVQNYKEVDQTVTVAELETQTPFFAFDETLTIATATYGSGEYIILFTVRDLVSGEEKTNTKTISLP